MWAGGSVASQHLRLPRDPFVSGAWQMLLGGGVCALTGALVGEFGDLHPAEFSLRSVVGLAYLVVFGSWLAFTAYAWLLQNAPVSRVATYAYVNPVVAIALGWAILDEAVTTLDVRRAPRSSSPPSRRSSARRHAAQMLVEFRARALAGASARRLLSPTYATTPARHHAHSSPRRAGRHRGRGGPHLLHDAVRRRGRHIYVANLDGSSAARADRDGRRTVDAPWGVAVDPARAASTGAPTSATRSASRTSTAARAAISPSPARR